MDAPAIDPSEFDLVVIGTGFTESVVAAAAAKAGHSVLQLDPSDHYGGSWASLHLEELQNLLGTASSSADRAEEQQPHQQAAAAAAGIRAGSAQVWQLPGAELGSARQYSLDLAPKVAYGAGPLIQLLLGSGAHNYLEFKLVQGSYLVDLGASASSSSGAVELRSVPSSRSEVFKDRQLSPVQKRSLMRFLKAAAEALDGEGPLKDAFGSQPIGELLAQQGLDVQLQQSLLHGVLLAGSSSSGDACGSAGQQLTAAEALERLRLFVQSAGRYGAGTGPFLTPLYGCGELPQAFSRVSAVAGAIQVLRCGIAGLSFDEHTFCCGSVELASRQAIRCQQLAASQAALEDWLHTFHPSTTTCSTHRCCAVLDGPLVPGEQHTMVAVLPAPAAPTGGATNRHVVRALALSSSTAVCPPGKFLLYLWVDADSSPQSAAGEVLLPALAALADTSGLHAQSSISSSEAAGAAGAAPADAEAAADAGASSSGSKPVVLWAAFYTQDSQQLLPSKGQEAGSGSTWPSNVALCPGPDGSVTFASAVEAAKQCYWQLFPAAGMRSAEQAAREAAAFPLDPGHKPQKEAADEEGEAGAAGSGAAGGADVDSDDEAVAALQAALQQAAVAPATAVGQDQ